jgi:hypothetical protein
MKKIIVLVSVFFGLVILGGCATDDIKSGKVESVKVEVVKTNLDKEDVFQLMPIIIDTGKTTTTTFVPYYSEVDNLVIKYKYKDKTYKVKTSEFEFVEISNGKTYARLEEKNIGKQDKPIVVYRN